MRIIYIYSSGYIYTASQFWWKLMSIIDVKSSRVKCWTTKVKLNQVVYIHNIDTVHVTFNRCIEKKTKIILGSDSNIFLWFLRKVSWSQVSFLCSLRWSVYNEYWLKKIIVCKIFEKKISCRWNWWLFILRNNEHNENVEAINSDIIYRH